MKDKIIQVSVTGRQDCYIIIGVTESGRIVASTGDRKWYDISSVYENSAPNKKMWKE